MTDILTLTNPSRRTEDPHSRGQDQKAEFDAAVSYVQSIIIAQATSTGLEQVFIGGISQGCAVAVQAFLKHANELAGFIGVSGWLPSPELLLPVNENPSPLTTSIFVAHCRDDETIGIEYGRQLRNELGHRTMDPWKIWYEEHDQGGHWLNETVGVNSLCSFIRVTCRAALLKIEEWEGWRQQQEEAEEELQLELASRDENPCEYGCRIEFVRGDPE